MAKGEFVQVGWFWRYNANENRRNPVDKWWFTTDPMSVAHAEQFDITLVPAYIDNATVTG